MTPMRRIQAHTVVMARPDVDTDQILPARFLTATGDRGYAEHAFADWRFHADGSPRPDSPLAGFDPKRQRILIAGNNFGCGSSREHAAWALRDLGIRAVISTRLADIFRANALKNGLAAIEIEAATWDRLAASPGAALTIDLEECRMILADGSQATFRIDRFGRYCLLNGVDELGFLLSLEEAIDRFERHH